MPPVLLDSEALSALAHPQANSKATRRAQAVLVAAHRTQTPVRIPAAVLAEVCRGARRDAAVNRVAHAIGRVVPTGERIARHAGKLLFSLGLDSAHAIDAFVVATAVALGGSVIATGDPKDIRRLAQNHPNVQVLAVE